MMLASEIKEIGVVLRNNIALCTIFINLGLRGDRVYNVLNRTRQGYARKRILKLAGHFFLGQA